MNNKLNIISKAIDVPYMDCKNIANIIYEYISVPYIYTLDSLPIELEFQYYIYERDDFPTRTFKLFKLSDTNFLVDFSLKETYYIMDSNKLKKWNSDEELEEVKKEELNSHIIYPNKSYGYDCKCLNCKGKRWQEIKKSKCLYPNVYIAYGIKEIKKCDIDIYFEKWFNELYNIVILSSDKIWNIYCSYNDIIIYRLREEDEYDEIEISETEIDNIYNSFSKCIKTFINKCRVK
jgi:hypothetical protein